MFKKALVPLDGSKTAEAALPYARLLAEQVRCPIELLQAIESSPHQIPTGATGERLHEQARLADRYLGEIAQTFPEDRAQYRSQPGEAADIIVDAAAQVPETLIVMSTHGRSGLSRWLLGSVAEKVLRAASNPLILIRASETAPGAGRASLDSIFVPLDGSKQGECALELALELARSLRIGLTLVSAYEIPATAYYRDEDAAGAAEFVPTREQLVEAMSRETRVYLDAKVKELSARSEKISGELVEGPAAERILDVARSRKGSLVAMCSHGRSNLRRWVLGSVTEKVVRHAEMPVLIVRAP